MTQTARIAMTLLPALTLAFALSGCVQTIDRPPVRLPNSMPSIPPATAPLVNSADAIDTATNALAQELMQIAGPRIRARRIAILPIRDTSGKAELIAATANDAFRVALFRTGNYHFVADNDMKRALREVLVEDKLRRADKALDPSVMSSLGKMLSAELIIDTRITDSITDFRFTAEMIDIARGDLIANAQQLIPQAALNRQGGSARTGPAGQSSQTLHLGGDWLHTRLASFGQDKDGAVRAQFVFTNRTSELVRLALSDPQRRAYLVDETGTPFVYAGADGLDQRGSATIRPDTRHEVSVFFSAPANGRGLLTMRTSWQASGTAAREKEFVVRDLVVAR